MRRRKTLFKIVGQCLSTILKYFNPNLMKIIAYRILIFGVSRDFDILRLMLTPYLFYTLNKTHVALVLMYIGFKLELI